MFILRSRPRAVFVLIPAAAILSGCEPCPYFPNKESCKLTDEYFRLGEELDALEPTPVEDMPTSGTATYDGIARTQLSLEPDSEAVSYSVFLQSQVRMTADFGSGQISGDMTNFNTFGNSVRGSLDIENGVISGNTFAADVNGIREQGDLEFYAREAGEFVNYGSGDVSVSGAMDGGFLGADAQGLEATMTGTAVLDAGPVGDVSSDVRALAE